MKRKDRLDEVISKNINNFLMQEGFWGNLWRGITGATDGSVVNTKDMQWSCNSLKEIAQWLNQTLGTRGYEQVIQSIDNIYNMVAQQGNVSEQNISQCEKVIKDYYNACRDDAMQYLQGQMTRDNNGKSMQEVSAYLKGYYQDYRNIIKGFEEITGIDSGSSFGNHAENDIISVLQKQGMTPNQANLKYAEALQNNNGDKEKALNQLSNSINTKQ